jgi:uncharacterized membrane protein YgcG
VKQLRALRFGLHLLASVFLTVSLSGCIELLMALAAAVQTKSTDVLRVVHRSVKGVRITQTTLYDGTVQYSSSRPVPDPETAFKTGILDTTADMVETLEKTLSKVTSDEPVFLGGNDTGTGNKGKGRSGGGGSRGGGGGKSH